MKRPNEIAPETELATEENFNEIAYLLANRDVALDVMEARTQSGFSHFIEKGASEGRRQLLASVSDVEKDRTHLSGSVPIAQVASHTKMPELAKTLGSREGARTLEIGSRKVTGAVSFRDHIVSHGGTYVGFDIHAGENVDIVGDAHKLSSYFSEGFDVIYSSAVFEHLAMPWVVATEIAKLLKVGGNLLIETHFSYSSHERPWHFFQFSDMALRCLFSPALGFECIEAGMSNPMVGRFSALADRYLKRRRINGLYCHSNLYAVKIKDVPDFDWARVGVENLVSGTEYPRPKA